MRRMSAQANALKRIGRSFPAGNTTGSPSVSTSSITNSPACNRAQLAHAAGGKSGRFRSTSSIAYGVVISVQPLAGALLKISREAPVIDPHSAKRTLVSRNSLTCPAESGACRLHLRRSNFQSLRGKICVVEAFGSVARASGWRETALAPVAQPGPALPPLLQFPRVCSRQ
jgi:hypothetical protein